MSFAFLPFYTGDYFRDTRGLSMAAHGCYFLLLTYCWDSKGPLPLDEEQIAGICNARSHEERTTMIKILGAYFVQMVDGYYNRRMQRVIERAEAISGKRKIAGLKGFEARAKQLPSKSSAIAKQLHQTPNLRTRTRITTRKTPTTGVDGERERKKGSRLQSSWKIPDEWIEWTIAAFPKLDRSTVIRKSIVFRDYWLSKSGPNAVKIDWLATWRNWMRKDQAYA